MKTWLKWGLITTLVKLIFSIVGIILTWDMYILYFDTLLIKLFFQLIIFFIIGSFFGVLYKKWPQQIKSGFLGAIISTLIISTILFFFFIGDFTTKILYYIFFGKIILIQDPPILILQTSIITGFIIGIIFVFVSKINWSGWIKGGIKGILVGIGLITVLKVLPWILNLINKSYAAYSIYYQISFFSIFTNLEIITITIILTIIGSILGIIHDRNNNSIILKVFKWVLIAVFLLLFLISLIRNFDDLKRQVEDQIETRNLGIISIRSKSLINHEDRISYCKGLNGSYYRFSKTNYFSDYCLHEIIFTNSDNTIEEAMNICSQMISNESKKSCIKNSEFAYNRTK